MEQFTLGLSMVHDGGESVGMKFKDSKRYP